VTNKSNRTSQEKLKIFDAASSSIDATMCEPHLKQKPIFLQSTEILFQINSIELNSTKSYLSLQ